MFHIFSLTILEAVVCNIFSYTTCCNWSIVGYKGHMGPSLNFQINFRILEIILLSNLIFLGHMGPSANYNFIFVFIFYSRRGTLSIIWVPRAPWAQSPNSFLNLFSNRHYSLGKVSHIFIQYVGDLVPIFNIIFIFLG